MKNILFILLMFPAMVMAKGKIQTQDIKTPAECVAAGATAATCLPKDTQIWASSANPPQTLDSAISSGALGGGGGGGSLQWVEDGNSPTPLTNEDPNRVYLYQSGLGQKLSAVIKVPHGFSGGSQIKMFLSFYSPDSSGTALMQTVSTLVRPGTDIHNSTTNQYTSTNSAVTLSGGTINTPQMVTFDLTDSIGKINGVSVMGDNIINVNLTRGSDSALSDLRVLVYGAEVTFH